MFLEVFACEGKHFFVVLIGCPLFPFLPFFTFSPLLSPLPLDSSLFTLPSSLYLLPTVTNTSRKAATSAQYQGWKAMRPEMYQMVLSCPMRAFAKR